MTLNIPETDEKRVVVVGGGFGGLTLVKTLRRSGYQVVLIDRNNFHMFQPLLYQVATAAINPGDIAFPFRKLFRGRPRLFFRMAEVVRVDPDRKLVYTDRGELRYDYLVLASGSTSNYFGMKNIERQSYAMKEVSEALAIRNRVLLHVEKAVELPDSPERRALLNIVIVGGGATGVELAGAFAEMKRNIMPRDYPEYHRGDINIYLIEGAPKVLGTMSDRTSTHALKVLKDMGVEVLLDSTVVDYRDGEVLLKDGRGIPTRNLIWTSGVTVALPAGLERFERGKGGRLVTDLYMRVKKADGIFAIGDASIQTDDPANPKGYPQLARVAMEQAGHLGRNLRRLEKGKTPRPFLYREYPVLATVGRNHAYMEYRKFWLGGFFGWLAWAGVHLFLILGVKNKLNVFMGWIWNYLTFDLPTRVVIIPHGSPLTEDVTVRESEKTIAEVARLAPAADSPAASTPAASTPAASTPAASTPVPSPATPTMATTEGKPETILAPENNGTAPPVVNENPAPTPSPIPAPTAENINPAPAKAKKPAPQSVPPSAKQGKPRQGKSKPKTPAPADSNPQPTGKNTTPAPAGEKNPEPRPAKEPVPA